MADSGRKIVAVSQMYAGPVRARIAPLFRRSATAISHPYSFRTAQECATGARHRWRDAVSSLRGLLRELGLHFGPHVRVALALVVRQRRHELQALDRSLIAMDLATHVIRGQGFVRL